MPVLKGKVSGEGMEAAVRGAMRAKTVEPEEWLARLRKAGVKYVVVYLRDAGEDPWRLD